MIPNNQMFYLTVKGTEGHVTDSYVASSYAEALTAFKQRYPKIDPSRFKITQHVPRPT